MPRFSTGATGPSGAELSPSQGVGGRCKSRARERERNAHVSQKHVLIHTSHTLCQASLIGSVHVSCCVVCCSASLLLVCSGVAPRAPRPPPEWPRDAREMTPLRVPFPRAVTRETRHGACPRSLRGVPGHSRNIYILNTKSHWDATTIIRSRATIPARSHEHVPHGPRFPQ